VTVYPDLLQIGEIHIPKKVVLAEALPILGTGKTDYRTLTDMALDEEENGSGLIAKITHLVKKTDSKIDKQEDESNVEGIEDITVRPDK